MPRVFSMIGLAGAIAGCGISNQTLKVEHPYQVVWRFCSSECCIFRR